MTVQELIDTLQASIKAGRITPDTEVWEERTGEHRRLEAGDIAAVRGEIVYDADTGDEVEADAVIFGAWD